MNRRFGMARLVAVIGAVVAALALAPAPAGAQEQPQGPAVEVTGIDLTEFPTVTLRFAVPGVTDLTPDAVDVTENGEPVEIAGLTPLSGQAIGVVLAVDTSGSMSGDAIEQAKAAAAQLVDGLPAGASVAVVGFGTTASVVSEFTTDRAAVQAALAGLQATGGTALYDALGLASLQVFDAESERTAMVVLTDGADSDSTSTLGQAIDAVTGSVDDFYAIALETGETDVSALQSLADAAEGRVVSASDPQALSAAFVDLGQRIVNQYAVSFQSVTDAPTGTFAISVPSVGATGSVAVALPDRAATTTTAPPVIEREIPEKITADVEPSVLGQGWAIYVGAALVAVAVIITLFIVVPNPEKRRRPSRRRLGSDAEVVEGNAIQRLVAGVRGAATGVSDRVVERADAAGTIDTALDRAGLVMRAGEFVAATGAVAAAAGVVLFLFLGPVGAVLGVVLPLVFAGSFLRFMATRRNAKFADQLSDTLLIMSGSLRSGFGVGQAIDTVAEEMDPPMSTEFQRSILETRLGRDIEDALQAVAERVQNEDFEWVVDAMRINKQVGGELAEILEQVSETIRARNRLKRQVSALTAEGRISAYVLGAMPILIGLFLFSSNPDYMSPLFERTIGWIMLGVGGGLLVIGALWLRKLIDIEY